MVGAGYVGLTTAASLAHLGHEVCCADVVPAKVAALSAGEIPIMEPGLGEMVRRGLDAGLLRFVLGAPAAARGASLVFLCVPTPSRPDGAADMTYIRRAAAEVGAVMAPGSIVVVKSTVPVGSTAEVLHALGRGDVAVVSNPEFLREGFAVQDCLHPDRIVIGATDRAVAERVSALYDGLAAPVVLTDPDSAQLIKYASNAFLATKVSFVNAIANLCEAVGADAREVVAGMGLDPRIGQSALREGPGWGGSCLPKDTAALLAAGAAAGYELDVLRAAIATNEAQSERVAAKVLAAAGGSLAGIRVAAWGLTFKAGTDDLRESPALKIIGRLVASGARVSGYDPTVRPPTARTAILPVAGQEALAEEADLVVREIAVCGDAYAACEGASVLVVLTEWPEFAELDFDKVATCMAAPVVVDARNVLDPGAMRGAGFDYQGIGRR